jgi:sugar phosphate isomerase/epimerase
MNIVHYKDMALLSTGEQVFAEVGAGNLNWPAIIDATLQTNVPWIVVEQDRCRRDPFASLTMSYQYLHQLL